MISTCGNDYAILTRSVGPHARTLELSLVVRSGFFFFFFCSVFAVRSPPLFKRGNFRRLT